MCGSRSARSPPRSSPRADLSRADPERAPPLAGLFCFCVSAPGLYDGGNEGKNVRVDLFDFELPEERIALRPAEPRETARLLVIGPEETRDAHVFDLPTFLRPGDVLVAYSDGVTEPENDYGEFGEERLIQLVRANRHLPLERITEIVTAAVLDWIGDNEQPDDVTLVLARAR